MFEGDELYSITSGAKLTIHADTKYKSRFDFDKNWVATVSWQPPRPKTVLVELLVEDAEYLKSWSHTRIYRAFCKALEEVKK